VTVTLEDFERDALPTLMAFGGIPNISPAYDATWAEQGHMDRAAELLADWVRHRSPSATVILHRLPGRTPTLTVTYEATDPGITGTVLLYGHLDKQPPLGEWSEGLAPFTAVRRGDRLYGRGLADDGYSTFAAITAIEDLRTAGRPHGRLVVLIEASEESGSPDLDAYLDELAPLLGDVRLLICLDSGALTYDRLWVTNSLRGNIVLTITAHVLERGQHSGAASGVVPSSFRVLRQLLDRIEDSSSGAILVPELLAVIPDHHRVAAEAVAAEFGDVAGDEQPIVAGLQLLGTAGADRLLRRTWSPTVSVVGVEGIPDVAVAGNVLRTHTTLTISLRTPPSVDTSVATEALVRTLTTDPPHGATVTVNASAAPGWVSPALAPWLADALAEASLRHFGRPVGYAGEGGTIPFLATLGQRYPGVAFVATGVLGPHANAHGIDEMLDLPTTVRITNVIVDVLDAYSKEHQQS
jgi:acetylornithine deacetylase/succinyl-diaminopimelate desuccinylase-like protein